MKHKYIKIIFNVENIKWQIWQLEPNNTTTGTKCVLYQTSRLQTHFGTDTQGQNVCTRFHGTPWNSCWYIPVWTKVVDWLTNWPTLLSLKQRRLLARRMTVLAMLCWCIYIMNTHRSNKLPVEVKEKRVATEWDHSLFWNYGNISSTINHSDI